MNVRSNRLDVLAVGAQTSSTIPQSSGRIFPVFLAQPEVVSLSVAQQCTVALVEEVFSVRWRCSVLFSLESVKFGESLPLPSTCRSQAHSWNSRPFSLRLGPSRFAMRKVLCWAAFQSDLTSFPSIFQTYPGPTTSTPATLTILPPISSTFPIKLASSRVA